MKKLTLFLMMTLTLAVASGCEITANLMYEDKISPTQSIKTTIELKKIEIGGKKK